MHISVIIVTFETSFKKQMESEGRGCGFALSCFRSCLIRSRLELLAVIPNVNRRRLRKVTGTCRSSVHAVKIKRFFRTAKFERVIVISGALIYLYFIDCRCFLADVLRIGHVLE